MPNARCHLRVFIHALEACLWRLTVALDQLFTRKPLTLHQNRFSNAVFQADQPSEVFSHQAQFSF